MPKLKFHAKNWPVACGAVVALAVDLGLLDGKLQKGVLAALVALGGLAGWTE